MKRFFLLFFVFTAYFSFGQNKIQGTVKGDQSLPLPGANVSILGTSTGGTTDFDGNFSLETDQDSGQIKISYIGFNAQVISINFDQKHTLDIGTIQLETDDNALEEVVLVGKGVIDLEQDRKTPIAVSTVTRDEIQLKSAGNVAFPNILKNTPSVYVSNESGGFGDSEMFVRGFGQSNTAFLINGQPVNGMTNGKMYWSNWSGLTDIVNAVQIQRGLGSSKLAISSVGGTINMVTKATARSQGGMARFLVGNDSYFKGTVSYDTGMSDKGWGFSFLLDYWQAHAKYANGTRGSGQNYFFSVGKKAGDHNFNLLITGAPQQHAQNFSKASDTKDDYAGTDNTDPLNIYRQYGRRFNNNYGFKNGQYLSERRNYYHKPVINLNWDWDIDEEQSLSTVLYASFGRGGATGGYGNGISHIDNGYAAQDYKDPYFYDFDNGAYLPGSGLIDWDYIVDQNKEIDGYADVGGYEGTALASSVNNHQWYGGVVNYEYNKIENLSLNMGADIRFFRGTHFKQLTDKLGLEGVVEEFGGNPNHIVTQSYHPGPWASLFNYAPRDQRVNFDYSENVNYQGGFAQAEWANDIFSVFVQGALSNKSYKREDRGNFEETKYSKTLNKTGYNLKGGASWIFADGNTIFVNAGKYSRQPHNNSIFTNYDDETEISNDLSNEEILGFEAGYRLEYDNLQVNLNAYYTKWKDRFLSAGGKYEDPETGIKYDNVSYLFTNIAQLHRGLELDIRWRPLPDLTFHGYGTLGKWEYDGKTPVKVRNNEEEKIVANLSTDLKETKVGQAPQTTAGLGVDYDIISNTLKAYLNWNYYTDFYGFVDVEDAALNTLEDGHDVYQPEKLNAYSLVDVGASYKFRIGDQRFQVNGNVYNIFNHWYVSQKDNYGYYLGNGLTYNFAVKYFF